MANTGGDLHPGAMATGETPWSLTDAAQEMGGSSSTRELAEVGLQGQSGHGTATPSVMAPADGIGWISGPRPAGVGIGEVRPGQMAVPRVPPLLTPNVVRPMLPVLMDPHGPHWPRHGCAEAGVGRVPWQRIGTGTGDSRVNGLVVPSLGLAGATRNLLQQQQRMAAIMEERAFRPAVARGTLMAAADLIRGRGEGLAQQVRQASQVLGAVADLLPTLAAFPDYVMQVALNQERQQAPLVAAFRDRAEEVLQDLGHIPAVRRTVHGFLTGELQAWLEEIDQMGDVLEVLSDLTVLLHAYTLMVANEPPVAPRVSRRERRRQEWRQEWRAAEQAEGMLPSAASGGEESPATPPPPPPLGPPPL